MNIQKQNTINKMGSVIEQRSSHSQPDFSLGLGHIRQQKGWERRVFALHDWRLHKINCKMGSTCKKKNLQAIAFWPEKLIIRQRIGYAIEMQRQPFKPAPGYQTKIWLSWRFVSPLEDPLAPSNGEFYRKQSRISRTQYSTTKSGTRWNYAHHTKNWSPKRKFRKKLFLLRKERS